MELSDGGGTYYAALKPIFGADKVVRLTLGLAQKRPDLTGFDWVEVNGTPALVLRYDGEVEGRKVKLAPAVLIRVELDGEGRIREMHSVLAPRKLTRMPAASHPE